jgi:hypothetical protein
VPIEDIDAWRPYRETQPSLDLTGLLLSGGAKLEVALSYQEVVCPAGQPRHGLLGDMPGTGRELCDLCYIIHAKWECLLRQDACQV